MIDRIEFKTRNGTYILIEPGKPTLSQVRFPANSLRDHRISAIKAVRSATGWSLREAKAFVDGFTGVPSYNYDETTWTQGHEAFLTGEQAEAFVTYLLVEGSGNRGATAVKNAVQITRASGVPASVAEKFVRLIEESGL